MPSNNFINGAKASKRSRRSARLNSEGIKRNVIVVGASAGGVVALTRLFEALPADIPAVIGVVLHRSTSPSELVHVLGRRSRLPVIEPSNRSIAIQGIIYLAPPDHHLLFDDGDVMTQRGPKEHGTRPAVDPLFRSAAAAYERRVVGVLLTGCGEDGVSGLIHISNERGITLAQDPREAYMPYMPLNALRFDEIGSVYSIHELAPALYALATGNAIISNNGKAQSR
ncbi:MAG TPA: chemotaxis protein CheB [Nitrospira sp.]|nr:chemotaxis protein CheB [Nitrospira sp.]